jgi:hypothetical protein
MLISAAFCPHPPLLVPEATGHPGPADAELARLRTACLDAVAVLTAGSPDLIAVVGGAPRTAEYPPGAPASLTEFGVPGFVSWPPAAPPADGADPTGGADPVALPLSLAIGKWLLSNAGQRIRPAQVAWWGIATDAPPAQCQALGEKIAALAPRVALLAMGDGPGCRARGVPGAVEPAADRYDDRVRAALAEPDPGVLAALDPKASDDLFASGRAAWQVAAGAAGGGDFTAVVGYAATPFEVTYFAASWRHRMTPGATGA